jgi:hypothetical protein
MHGNGHFLDPEEGSKLFLKVSHYLLNNTAAYPGKPEPSVRSFLSF